MLGAVMIFVAVTDIAAQAKSRQDETRMIADSSAAPEIDLGEIRVEVQKHNATIVFPRVRANYAPALSRKDLTVLTQLGLAFIIKNKQDHKQTAMSSPARHGKVNPSTDSMKKEKTKKAGNK